MASVDTMSKLIHEAEGWIARQRDMDYKAHGTQQLHKPIVPVITNHLDGMASAVVKASRNLNAKCVIVLSRNGNTCRNIAKFRPDVPIVAIVPSQKVGRFLQIHRGVSGHDILVVACVFLIYTFLLIGSSCCSI